MAESGVERKPGGWALAVHGGAGAITNMSSIPLRKAAFHEIVEAGKKMLEEGYAAVDVVQHVVEKLEDCKYFNAGRGSVMTHDGTFEMDAIIADGTEHTVQ